MTSWRRSRGSWLNWASRVVKTDCICSPFFIANNDLVDFNMENLYFVDYENIQNLNFEMINPESDLAVIFVGKNQSKIGIDVVMKTQRLGAAIEWTKMDGAGRNALDFHIAYYLGHATASLEAARAKCNIYVVSKDEDYDVLIKHIQSLGHQCHRLTAIDPSTIVLPKLPNSTLESTDVSMTQQDAGGRGVKLDGPFSGLEFYGHVVEKLKKVDKLKRPRTAGTLTNHIITLSQNKITESVANNIMNELSKYGKIKINNGRVSYNF